MIRVFLCDDDPSYLEYLSGIVGQFFQQNKIEAGIKTFLDGDTSGRTRDGRSGISGRGNA